MKKAILYEVLAAIMMIVGAVCFVYVYIPIINPELYAMSTDRETAPIMRYIVGTPVALLILMGAWYCKRKAQKLKLESEGEEI